MLLPAQPLAIASDSLIKMKSVFGSRLGIYDCMDTDADVASGPSALDGRSFCRLEQATWAQVSLHTTISKASAVAVDGPGGQHSARAVAPLIFGGFQHHERQSKLTMQS